MLFNRVRCTTTTTGTGPIEIGNAVAGFRAFHGVVPDGARVPYVIEQGADFEMGHGVYANGRLTREPHTSSAGGHLNLSGNAVVAIAPGAADIATTDHVARLEQEVARLNAMVAAIIEAASDVAAAR